MRWLFKSDADDKVDQLDKRLKESFERVKEDTHSLYEWIQYLHGENTSLQDELAQHKRLVAEHKAEIRHLRDEIRQLPITREGIKKVVDSYYDFEAMLQRIQELESRISQLAQQRAPAQTIREEPQKVTRKALQDKIVKRITRRSKEYIKGLILNMIQRYGKASALQLREMVVEEQGLCSKSSFYRVLEELEKEGSVGVISSGKEKVYTPEKLARK